MAWGFPHLAFASWSFPASDIAQLGSGPQLGLTMVPGSHAWRIPSNKSSPAHPWHPAMPTPPTPGPQRRHLPHASRPLILPGHPQVRLASSLNLPLLANLTLRVVDLRAGPEQCSPQPHEVQNSSDSGMGPHGMGSSGGSSGSSSSSGRSYTAPDAGAGAGGGGIGEAAAGGAAVSTRELVLASGLRLEPLETKLVASLEVAALLAQAGCADPAACYASLRADYSVQAQEPRGAGPAGGPAEPRGWAGFEESKEGPSGAGAEPKLVTQGRQAWWQEVLQISSTSSGSSSPGEPATAGAAAGAKADNAHAAVGGSTQAVAATATASAWFSPFKVAQQRGFLDGEAGVEFEDWDVELHGGGDAEGAAHVAAAAAAAEADASASAAPAGHMLTEEEVDGEAARRKASTRHASSQGAEAAERGTGGHGGGRVCFTVRASGRPVLLLVLESALPGHFSDNLLELDPCWPRRVCFTREGDRDGWGEGGAGSGMSGSGEAWGSLQHEEQLSQEETEALDAEGRGTGTGMHGAGGQGGHRAEQQRLSQAELLARFKAGLTWRALNTFSYDY